MNPSYLLLFLITFGIGMVSIPAGAVAGAVYLGFVALVNRMTARADAELETFPAGRVEDADLDAVRGGHESPMTVADATTCRAEAVGDVHCTRAV